MRRRELNNDQQKNDEEIDHAILRNTIWQSRFDTFLKVVFFTVVIYVFYLLCDRGISIILSVADKEDSTASDITAIIGAFASVVTAILVLPKIMANHLFPANGEEARYKFISSLKELEISGNQNNNIADDVQMMNSDQANAEMELGDVEEDAE